MPKIPLDDHSRLLGVWLFDFRKDFTGFLPDKFGMEGLNNIGDFNRFFGWKVLQPLNQLLRRLHNCGVWADMT